MNDGNYGKFKIGKDIFFIDERGAEGSCGMHLGRVLQRDLQFQSLLICTWGDDFHIQTIAELGRKTWQKNPIGWKTPSIILEGPPNV